MEAAAGTLAEDNGEAAGGSEEESTEGAEEDDVSDGHDEHQAKPLLENVVAEHVGGQAEHDIKAACNLCEEAGPKTTKAAERVQTGWASTRATTIKQTVFPLRGKKGKKNEKYAAARHGRRSMGHVYWILKRERKMIRMQLQGMDAGRWVMSL